MDNNKLNSCKFLKLVDDLGKACHICKVGEFECQYIYDGSWNNKCSVEEAYKNLLLKNVLKVDKNVKN